MIVKIVISMPKTAALKTSAVTKVEVDADVALETDDMTVPKTKLGSKFL